jgi:hypothetical protein
VYFKRFYAHLQNCEKRLSALSCPSVCLSAWKTRPPLDGFWWNFILEFYSKICQENPIFRKNPTRITGSIHKDLFTFMTISRWILFRMRNISNKPCRENQSTHFMLSNNFAKYVSFMRKCRKIWWSQRGRKWQYGALHAGFSKAYTRASTHQRLFTPTHTHESTPTLLRTHTHINM